MGFIQPTRFYEAGRNDAANGLPSREQAIRRAYGDEIADDYAQGFEDGNTTLFESDTDYRIRNANPLQRRLI